MGKEKIELNDFTVKEGDREMQVVIPKSNDKVYDDYLELAEREKTADWLRKRPPKPEPKYSKKERAGIIREYSDFIKRRNNGQKKYF